MISCLFVIGLLVMLTIAKQLSHVKPTPTMLHHQPQSWKWISAGTCMGIVALILLSFFAVAFSIR
jgi:hypothetical protein